MKERMTKKILAIFLTIAMCLTLMPVTAFAEIPIIQNINISEEGILTFDEVPGALRYEVDIRSNVTERKKLSRPVTSGTNIFETIMKRYKFPTARYYLEMWAYDSEDSGCGSLTSDNAYYFDYESPLIELVPPTNLRWDGYTARWDEVPNCEKYRINLYSKYGNRNSSIETEDTFYNYGTDVGDGEYFKVEAIGGDGYIDSVESAKSPVWKIQVVREVNIVVTPPIAGEIPDYNASTDSKE